MPSLLNFVNLAACAILLGYALYTANIMPHRGLWPHRLMLWALALAVGVQAVAPWLRCVPDPNWTGTAIVVVLAAGSILWRRDVVAFLRYKFCSQEFISMEDIQRYTRRG